MVNVIIPSNKNLLLIYLLFKQYLDLFIQLPGLAWADGCGFITVCLSLVCHCFDSWFHVWHTTIANIHFVSVDDFGKHKVWWKVLPKFGKNLCLYKNSCYRKIKPNYISFLLLFWCFCWGIFWYFNFCNCIQIFFLVFLFFNLGK